MKGILGIMIATQMIIHFKLNNHGISNISNQARIEGKRQGFL
jgi:hypothetical protein